MAFMKDILTRNIPIWEECAATPFVQEVQTGKLPLEKFKRYMIQDSIYLKNYARIYGKAIFHADTLREIQLYYSMLNFVNDTESEVRLDYLKQFCMTDNDIELIAPLPENQNYIDFMFEIASHGKNEEILMAVLPCMLSGKDYCTPHTLPFQVLNDIVLGDLKQIIRNVENLQELVKSQSFTATKIRKSTDIELTKLKAELERVKKLKKSIYEDYKDELISKEEFLSYREDYQQKETLYSKQIETLEEKKKESVTEDVFETPWLRRLLELKDIEELDRDIIVEMIDQITVYENRKLKISYNFGNELEHLFSSVYCEDLEKKAI